MVEMESFLHWSIFNFKRYFELKKKEKGKKEHNAVCMPDSPGVQTSSVPSCNNITNFQNQTQINEN